MISQERIGELESCFWDETNDEETQSWRDDLEVEEQELVDKWDGQYASSICKMCKEILALEKN